MDYIKINQIKEKLEACLDEERYQHSLGTAECALELASRYGANTTKAYLAGLVHDCAKCETKESLENVLRANQYTLNLTECEFTAPKTFHAPAGAIIAKQRFDIDDEEVLSAIRWHTIGKKDMTILEKIVYLADKIESKTRPKDCREPLEELLKEEEGLDKAILESYRRTIKSLVERNLPICYQTIEVYNSLL